MTFSLLDREKGITELPPVTDEEYPLPAWYCSVRDVALEDLTLGDIAKACRQQIHLDYTVPIALIRLTTDPFGGEIYEGELLASMKSVPREYWAGHLDDGDVLMSCLRKVLKTEHTSEEVRQDAEDIMKKLGFSK